MEAIEDYGLIGNLLTAALVSKRTCSIDHLCWPHFDSPMVYGRLLDCERGGCYCIEAMGATSTKQRYLPDTNVLMTRFHLPSGMIQVTDWMPVTDSNPIPWLVRRIEGLRGTGGVRITVRPAFDYGRAQHQVRVTEHVNFVSEKLKLQLVSKHAIDWQESNGGVCASLDIVEGDSICLVLRDVNDAITLDPLCTLTETIQFWQRWLQGCSYRGRWREAVERSCLALKLMCFHPTGAIVAAPTCSLPEHLGGTANWDYRFVWIRDAAFTVYAFLRVGLKAEAAAFMKWIERLLERMDSDGSKLRVMYDIHTNGSEHCPCITEEILEHWSGYRGSRPVRIGNAAESQTQLDIYGELMDAIYLVDKHVEPISHDFWIRIKRHIISPVLQTWRQPDHGLWEIRATPKHYVYSKVMAWVTLDRAVRLVAKHSFPGPVELWRQERDVIYELVMEEGYCHGHFTQTLQPADILDASCLILPMVFFCPATDPRMLSTLQAILSRLTVNQLVYRYEPPEEATFTLCTFWLVEAMARAGWLPEARIMFEEVLGYGNHVGLFGEQLSLEGRALGNFPQAFTHFSLISAAFNLSRRLP